MKKTIVILSALCFVFTVAQAKGKKEKKDKKSKTEVAPASIMANEVDSMSYSLGLNIGADFAKNIKNIPGGKYNNDLLIKGFVTSMKGDSALIDGEKANEYVRAYIDKEQKKELAAKTGEAEKFLSENKSKPGVQTTLTGLQYEILTPAEGPKPKATDSVKVHYQGFLLDGTKFDSSVDRGEPITFPLNQVIPGWTEGVQLMSVGSKYKFYVPSDLGYGEKGAGQVIPPFATLIFEVELLEIKPVVEAAVEVEKVAPAKAAPAKAASKGKKK